MWEKCGIPVNSEAISGWSGSERQSLKNGKKNNLSGIDMIKKEAMEEQKERLGEHWTRKNTTTMCKGWYPLVSQSLVARLLCAFAKAAHRGLPFWCPRG